jgi:hypothetical protein
MQAAKGLVRRVTRPTRFVTATMALSPYEDHGRWNARNIGSPAP